LQLACSVSRITSSNFNRPSNSVSAALTIRLKQEGRSMTVKGYDLVGDIHGHADALHRLLRELDYSEVEGLFRHPQRKMIFVW
jgi:hypothetical protein